MTLPSIEELAARAGELDPRFLALALAFQLANLGLRAIAWRNILAAAYRGQRVPVFSICAAYVAGVALNTVLPARSGEAAKVLLARTRIPGSSVATIAASSTVLLVADTVLGIALVAGAWSIGALPTPPLPSLPWPVLLAAVPLLAVAGAAAVRFAPRLRGLGRQLRQGVAILGTPGVYMRRVAAPQLGAWLCRVGVAASLLAAFGISAPLTAAALVVVAGGLSTAVPTPGGVGTQQALVVVALHGWVSATGALSFSVGLQILVTAVNATIGVAAMMLLVRTLRPVAAVRAGFAAARSRPS